MQILSLIVAVYGAVVATCLGYLTYRRERHRVRLRFRLEAGGDEPPCLAIYVVNQGIRAVTIRSGHFFWIDEEGGLGPDLRSAGPLPARLDDGDELRLGVPIDEVIGEPDGFLIEDTTGREHRQQFSPAFFEQLTLFRRWVNDTEMP
ncbi:MAG TPA: hypothetical protein VK781_12940 [Solirubrobacteraceae bacterium]|nr:hypothetical protein [Solirubrobacteraceae bacterium]